MAAKVAQDAAFVAAVLSDNERLRQEVESLRKKVSEGHEADRRTIGDLRRIIWHWAEGMGGDVLVRAHDRVDGRRLVIERDGYRDWRIRLVADKEVAVGGGVFKMEAE